MKEFKFTEQPLSTESISEKLSEIMKDLASTIEDQRTSAFMEGYEWAMSRQNATNQSVE